ncbi:MAG: hypothetical protein COA52_00710 [Hyphomicrobiales bacterium]|nr:MAG: hypothetical protein COA52_00710 [Hyphomicrobiales bacterium]
MIKTKYITLKSNSPLKSYYKGLGYNVSQAFIDVEISHLKKESNYYVDCACDLCDSEYKQRFSRNTGVCSKCRNKVKKKFKKSDNSLKYSDFKNWEEDIRKFTTKKDAIEFLNSKYKISLNYSTFNEVLKRLGIELLPISKILKETIIPSEIALKYNITTTRVNSIFKTNNVERPTSKREFNRNIIIRDWSLIETLNASFDIPTIIEKLNYDFSETLLRNSFYERNIPIIQHSYNKSKGEIELLEWIKSLGVDCKSIKFKTSGGLKEIDCYCPDYKFGIEYCGLWHHSYNSGKPKRYHLEKSFLMKEEHDIQIFTIFENEWINSKNLIKNMIKSRLQMNKKIFARKCTARNITAAEARKFHNKNHISGYVNSSINVGLYYENMLVSCMSFSKSRYDKNYEYEITRMSFLQGHTIVGGASKMFKFSGIKSIMTFADFRFGEGKVYEKLGFKNVGLSAPNYFYNKKGTMKLESRIKYQKHKLKNILDVYDENLSEQKNMVRNNFLTIYDCGNYKWVI